ncbi:MAG: histidine phosphatase family protein [Devosia sp.]|nr:histidine phosphatase family protein [Devosia sp.]
MRALYLTHPQVRMDPNVPVPLWPLSEEGRARAEQFVARRTVPEDALVFSSREAKALELAELVAAAAGTPVLADHLMGENDRSATGFLPPSLFEQTADAFFAHPEQSIEGWERAIDAQSRIVETIGLALGAVREGTPVVFCGHGAVGTLLKCHLGGRAIARSEDQSRHGHRGGGNGFVFEIASRTLIGDWMAMEEIKEGWWE